MLIIVYSRKTFALKTIFDILEKHEKTKGKK